MDDVGNTLAADGLDGEVDIFQAERVGRYLLKRKALRCELFERQFARLVAVAARALDRNELHGHFADGEIRELRHFALNDDRTELAKTDSTLGDHTASILAVLQVTEEELSLIKASEGLAETGSLNLANLSRLYRYASLAKALDLSIEDGYDLSGRYAAREASPRGRIGFGWRQSSSCGPGLTVSRPRFGRRYT